MADGIKIGNLEISAFKVGGNDCEIYLGDVKLYPQSSQHDYSKDYFTIKSLSDDNAVKITRWGKTGNTEYYSLYSGTTWTQVPTGTSEITIATINSGETLMIKSEANEWASTLKDHNSLTCTKDYDVCGNIMSLIYGDNFKRKTEIKEPTSTNAGTFCGLFWYTNETGDTAIGSTTLKSAENLVLPATTLKKNTYNELFRGCTNLEYPPKELPATTLASACYNSMFKGCTSLTTAPELHVTTLAGGCYNNMFQGCTSLTTAPELPATTLANSCYYGMFSGCTSLTIAPELPATTLSNNCYQYMFNGCSNLKYIKCLAIDISASNCTSNWVYGVSTSGLFVKNPNMTVENWGRGTSRIPNNWDIKDDGEPIPVTGAFVIGSMYVQTNKTRSLNATVLPIYADNKNLTFESRDTSIVTVDENGVISGVSTGSTTIIITTAESGFTAQCNVSVIEYSSYTLIEYIESTQSGGQYIDTGLKMWETMPVEYEVDMGVNMLGKGKDNHNQAVIISNNYEVSPWPGFVIRKTNNSNSIEQNNFPKVASYGQLGEYLDIHQAQSNINDTTHNVTVSLFCGKNSSGTPFRYSRTRLYYCKLRANSSTWQREFVPAKNEQDVIGLLDIVEGEFYKSPNDVEFIGGREVSQ
jgi:hypothetical protein